MLPPLPIRTPAQLDLQQGVEIKARPQDAQSAGVPRQDEMRRRPDPELFVGDTLWSRIGPAHGGCDSAIGNAADDGTEEMIFS